MRKRYLRNLLVFVLVFIIGFTVVPQKANAASYFTGNKWNKSIVSIYIDDTPSVSGIPSYLYPLMRSNIIAAVTRWNIYLNNTWDADIMFTYADSASSADVLIHYGSNGGNWAQTLSNCAIRYIL